MEKLPLIIICGPTAIGKSSIAVSLAQGRGEIISADSMQIYKYLNIGTAKPEKGLLKQVKHHLIDAIKPDEEFSVYNFICQAGKIIKQIHKKKLLPFVVGGTGLYIHALIYGLSDAPGRNENLRKKLNRLIEKRGLLFLYKKLQKIDPAYASVINASDKTRIIRALEVYYLKGRPFSFYIEKHDKQENYNALWIGINQPRDELYRKINLRTEQMYKQGLIEETRNLLKKGFSEVFLSKKGIGYKEALAFIHNKITLQEAIEETKKKTRHYAKRQITWFKKEENIKWFYPDKVEQIREYINLWIREKGDGSIFF